MEFDRYREYKRLRANGKTSKEAEALSHLAGKSGCVIAAVAVLGAVSTWRGLA
jgi:hypothetical protein